jgi:hypothetical protein
VKGDGDLEDNLRLGGWGEVDWKKEVQHNSSLFISASSEDRYKIHCRNNGEGTWSSHHLSVLAFALCCSEYR